MCTCAHYRMYRSGMYDDMLLTTVTTHVLQASMMTIPVGPLTRAAWRAPRTPMHLLKASAWPRAFATWATQAPTGVRALRVDQVSL